MAEKIFTHYIIPPQKNGYCPVRVYHKFLTGFFPCNTRLRVNEIQTIQTDRGPCEVFICPECKSKVRL